LRWRVETPDVQCVTVGSGMLENTRAFGLLGAKPGSIPTIQVASGADGAQTRLGLNAFHPVHQGDVFQIISQGGGGFGDPFERDPEQVLRDVVDGFVSAESARMEYGVIVVEVDGGVALDREATRRERSARRSANATHDRR
jgi:N-methylhydantoinase B